MLTVIFGLACALQVSASSVCAQIRVSPHYWAIEVFRDGELEGIGTIRFESVDGELASYVFAKFTPKGGGVHANIWVGQGKTGVPKLIPPDVGAVFSHTDALGYPTTGRLTFSGKRKVVPGLEYYNIESFEIVYQGPSKLLLRPITELGWAFKKTYLEHVDLGSNDRFNTP